MEGFRPACGPGCPHERIGRSVTEVGMGFAFGTARELRGQVGGFAAVEGPTEELGQEAWLMA